MRVIICGAGQVGFGIARHLADEGNEVTVIDRSRDLIAHIQNQLDVRPVLGPGAHPQILREARADNTDMLIAVTASDEVNMITCTVARNLFNTPKTIARVRDIKYLDAGSAQLFSSEGIAVDVIISPELEVAKSVTRRINMPGAFDNASFGANGEVQMIGLHIHEDCPVIDTPLNQLTDLFPTLEAIVVGIRRNDELYVPNTLDSLLVGDQAYLIVSAQDAERTLKIFGEDISVIRRVVIVGAGNIGLEVARELNKNRYGLTVIENNHVRAQNAADVLKRRVTILQGSGLSPDILADAEVRNADIILALTNDDQVNILSNMLALQEGCPKGMSLINDRAFLNLTGRFGMETAINPRAVTVSSVLQHVRRGSVQRVHAVEDGHAEIIEATVLEKSELMGQKIRNLHLPEGLRLGAIIRNGKVIKPRGNTDIKLNDSIILFTLSNAIENAEKLFAEPDTSNK